VYFFFGGRLDRRDYMPSAFKFFRREGVLELLSMYVMIIVLAHVVQDENDMIFFGHTCTVVARG